LGLFPPAGDPKLRPQIRVGRRLDRVDLIRRLLPAAFLALFLSAGASGLEIGGAVPTFTAMTIQGESFSLSEAERNHRAIVVIFRSTLCPYSNYYNDALRDLVSSYGAKGVLLVAVHSDRAETVEEIRAHARQHGHTFPVIRDPRGELARLLDARRTPEAFVLDASGKLRYHGRIASKLGAPDLRNALDALLAGKPIRPAETRSFGCSIDRS
jgi:peroxiredoxin